MTAVRLKSLERMPVHETLSLWENFYVIVGSSAGALTGLQFVVMALIPDSPTQAGEHEINTFGTPTVVHFCIVLFISAVLSVPWPGWHAVATIVWVTGALGIVYTMIVIRRSRRTTLYKPVLEAFQPAFWYSRGRSASLGSLPPSCCCYSLASTTRGTALLTSRSP